MKNTKKGKFTGLYLPLVLILAYLAVSYLMYRFGCYVWTFRKDSRTCIFIMLCMLAVAVGYILSIRWKEHATKECSFVAKISAEKILIVSGVIAIVLFVPTCKAYTNSWYPPVVQTLLDPKGTYYSLAQITSNRTGLRIWGFFDVFSYILLPLTLWEWDNLKKWVRTLAMVVSIGYLMIYISSARNIAVAIQMLSVAAVWLSVLCFRRKEGEKKKLGRITLLTVGYIILVVSFFSLTMSSRTGYDESVYVALKENEEKAGNTDKWNSGDNLAGTGADNLGNVDGSSGTSPSGTSPSGTNPNENSRLIEEFEEKVKKYNLMGGNQPIGIGIYEYNGLSITQKQLEKFCEVYSVFPNYTDAWSKSYVNMGDPLVKNLPAVLSNLYVVGTAYVTNGYNCLTVSLHSDHQWTYGVGHSTFLSNYIDRFFHTDISGKTYYERLTNDEEYPLVSKSHWPSTFAQLAGDLTFAGVIFFMALVGFVIGKVWRSIVLYKNYWGVLLLGQLMLGVLFIPANNILGCSGGFFVTFWSLFIMWFLSQLRPRKRNVK